MQPAVRRCATLHRSTPRCSAKQSSRAVAVAAESRAGCNAQHHDATHRAARATHPVALLGVLQALGRVPRALLALADGSHTARLHADADFAPPPTARVTAFRQRRAVVVQVRNRFRCMTFFNWCALDWCAPDDGCNACAGRPLWLVLHALPQCSGIGVPMQSTESRPCVFCFRSGRRTCCARSTASSCRSRY